MTNGLILLVFLALLVAIGVTRLRRRAGMGVTGKMFLTVMAVFAVGVLIMWAYSQR